MQKLITRQYSTSHTHKKTFLLANLKNNPHQLGKAGSSKLFIKILHSILIYSVEHKGVLSEKVSK